MKKVLLALWVSVLMITTSLQSVSALESELDLSKIDELTKTAISDEIFPGATVLVKRKDQVLYHESWGHAQLFDMGLKYETPILASNETIYDLASVTKVMATTQALMILNYQGKIDLDEKVSTYMPDFAQNGKGNVTVRDLLTHTSGLTPWKPTFLYVNTRAQEKDYVNKLPLEYPTQSKMAYSDFSFMALAFLVEEVTQLPLEEFLHQELYGPLNLKDTMFTPLLKGVDKNRIAATSWGNPYEWRMSNELEYPKVGYDTSEDHEAFKKFTGWREYTLIGEVNDGNAGMANEGIAGHAGLFSTAQDLSVIGDVLLNGGTLNGKTFYDQKVITEFTRNDETRFNRGLGWQVNGAAENRGYVGKYATDSVFSHAGFTGTQVIFDSDYDLQVIILTNKQNLGHDEGKYKSPYKYSRDIMNLVYETLDEAIKTVDKTELKEALEKNYDEKLYTSDSFSNYTSAVNKAQSVLDDEKAIQSDVDQALKLLNNSVENLMLKANKQPLEDRIKEIEKEDLSNYTLESREVLEQAITDAKNVLTLEDVNDEMIMLQLSALNKAYEALELLGEHVVKLDTTKLEALVKQAESLNRTKYTDASLNVMDKALLNAKEVLNKVNKTRSIVSQEDVDTAVKDLELSLNQLVLVKSDVNTGLTSQTGIYVTLLFVSVFGVLISRKLKNKRIL